VRTENGELEQTTDQALCGQTDDHVARLSQLLKAGGEVRGLADHRSLLGLTRANQLADHDQARCDPDPGGERCTILGLQAANRVRQFESGLHGPLGVLLMRGGPAKVGEQTIAHVLGDVSLPALDDLSAALTIGAHERTQVLGIEPCRELG